MIVVFADLLDHYLLTIVTCASVYESFATLSERATNMQMQLRNLNPWEYCPPACMYSVFGNTASLWWCRGLHSSKWGEFLSLYCVNRVSRRCTDTLEFGPATVRTQDTSTPVLNGPLDISALVPKCLDTSTWHRCVTVLLGDCIIHAVMFPS